MDAEKKETKEINKMSLLIMAVVVLLLIITGAAYYIFHQNQQMSDFGVTVLEGNGTVMTVSNRNAFWIRNHWKTNLTNCLSNMKDINLI